jgi:Protein of unknown function (DUF3352)
MFRRDVPREPRKPKLEFGPETKSLLGKKRAGRGDEVARRLRALRDIGPGSGSSSAWLNDLRRRFQSGSWGGIPQTTRVRILAALVVVATAAFVYFVLIPVAPCSFPGGDSCPPGDDAIALVPDDALAYGHVDIDRGTDQVEAITESADRAPLLSDIAASGLSGLTGLDADFETRIEPWAGGEMAVALMPAGTSVGRVVMIEAADTDRAEQFAAELYGSKQSSTDVDGTELAVGRHDFAWAVDHGFLILGREGVLTNMLEAPTDSRLPDSEGAGVIDELPEDRLAYGYLSAAGARAMLSVRGLEPIDTFVDSAATEGAAAAVTADGSGIHLTVRSELDPERAKTSPGFFAALPRFEPALTADVGPGALAYLGLGDPAASVESLLDQARSTSPGLVAAFRRASKDLKAQAGVDIGKDLLPLLSSEVALSVQPVVAAASDPATPGVVADASTPYVSLIADGIDAGSASRALAELQEPVAKALAPRRNGRVAVFETIQVAGVQAQSLAVSPALNPTYATYGDRLVIATDSLGIEQARSIDSGLNDAPAFEQATEGMPDSVSLLAYFDLVGLLSLGEQVGLAVDPTYAAYAPDLRSLTAAAISVDGGDDQIRTDLEIVVGPRQDPEIASPSLPGE